MPIFHPRITQALAMASALCLTSCGGGETPQPAGLSRDESDALNDAAEMLDAANNGQALPPQNSPR